RLAAARRDPEVPAARPVMAARAVLEAAAVSRDVVLFQHDRGRFFRLVGLFCASQGLFWAYLAHFAFTALRPVPGAAPGPDEPLRPRDNKWRYGFTASCLTVGSLVLAAGWLLPQRSVRRLTLLRGGSAVTIATHGPLGLGRRSLTVPLRDVSGSAHRAQVAAAVPIKVRGRPFFFLLDKAGQFHEPRLFDVTVGALRRL
ncbi:TM223 protein, partial [Spelaeornis formosus]|nr:TM223 protein [Elachura formosa]